MKHKGLWIISILLIGMIVVAIWVYPNLVFIKAMLSLKDMESVHIEGTFLLSNSEYELKLKGTANYANNIVHATLSTNYGWDPLQAEMYIELEKKDVNFYLTTNLSEEWVTSNHKLTSNVKLKNISLKDIHFQKVKSDRKGEKKYKVVLSKDLFQSLLSSISKDSEVEKETILFLYVKDNSLSGIKIEDQILLSKSDHLYLRDIDLQLSSFNGISNHVVPKEVIENSKLIDKNVLKILFS